jgi:foldase protein PrsA
MRYLILSEAKAKDIVVADEEVNSYIKNLESSFKQDLAPVLEQLGVTLEELRTQVREQLMITQLLVEEASVGDLSISDKDLKDFYESSKDSLMVGERVEASHILLETEEEAEAVVKELGAGANFAELATEKSTDPSAKTNKGNLGFFERGQMVKEFEDVAFSLKVGKISEPTKSQFGYHVIIVHKRESAKQLAFDEVKDNIKQVLLEQRQQEILASYIEKLREKAQIKIF